MCSRAHSSAACSKYMYLFCIYTYVRVCVCVSEPPQVARFDAFIAHPHPPTRTRASERADKFAPMRQPEPPNGLIAVREFPPAHCVSCLHGGDDDDGSRRRRRRRTGNRFYCVDREFACGQFGCDAIAAAAARRLVYWPNERRSARNCAGCCRCYCCEGELTTAINKKREKCARIGIRPFGRLMLQLMTRAGTRARTAIMPLINCALAGATALIISICLAPEPPGERRRRQTFTTI